MAWEPRRPRGNGREEGGKREKVLRGGAEGRASPLGFAQSGSSVGRSGFSNDWKKCFQWLENYGRGFLGLEKVFGMFWETNGTTGATNQGENLGGQTIVTGFDNGGIH